MGVRQISDFFYGVSNTGLNISSVYSTCTPNDINSCPQKRMYNKFPVFIPLCYFSIIRVASSNNRVDPSLNAMTMPVPECVFWDAKGGLYKILVPNRCAKDENWYYIYRGQKMVGRENDQDQ